MDDAAPWDAAAPPALRPALRGCADGLPPNVAILRLITAARDPGEVESALAVAAPGGAGARIAAARALWRANPQAFGAVKRTLAGVEHDGPAGPDAWAATFDRLAAASPEGGVALYALGNPDLLAAATAEVVDRLAAWGCLGGRVLELGCGSGRLVAAMAPRAAHVTGLDVSPGMVARARERCAGLPNVALAVTAGRDLAGIPSASLDCALAADVFPYLVPAGLAPAHVREAARALAPGGRLAVLNWSYRGDAGQDRAEAGQLAAEAGLQVERMATGDFALWDAATFLFRR